MIILVLLFIIAVQAILLYCILIYLDPHKTINYTEKNIKLLKDIIVDICKNEKKV